MTLPKVKRIVQMESPFKCDVDKNIAYGRACMADCLKRGEAPFASHLLYTQPGVLDDSDPIERMRGIDAGLLFATNAEATVVYTDLGISEGMHYGIRHAIEHNRPVEYRRLQPIELPTPETELRDRLIKEIEQLSFDHVLVPKMNSPQELSNWARDRIVRRLRGEERLAPQGRPKPLFHHSV